MPGDSRETKDLFREDVAVANHADLKPIQRQWDSSGHEYDEGVLRQALLAQQAADLRRAQRDGWIPPQPRLGTLLPCFATADGRSEGLSEGRPGRTLSTATSGLSAMDTDDGSGELTAAAAAAALASQEERAAAEATAAAARQARREQRRAEKEARRQKLLQEKKEAKARARAEARRRYEDQLHRWEAAVADKRQQVAELQQQSAQVEEGIRAAEERAKELEEQKHAMFLKLKKALDEEQAEKQRKQQLAGMEEGEVTTSLQAGAAGGMPGPAASAGGAVRSPSFAQPYGGPGAPLNFGPLGPKLPGDPAPGYGGGGGFYGGRGGPAAGPAGGGAELWEDGRTRDAWGTAGGGPGPGSAASTPRGHRDMLGPALGFGGAGGGTPLAGERERASSEFGWRAGGDYRGGPPGGSGGGRERGSWRGSFDDRRPPPLREYSREFPPGGGGASRDGLGGSSRDGAAGPGPLGREFSSSRDGLGAAGSLSREHSLGASRDYGGPREGREGGRGYSPPRFAAPPGGREGGGQGGRPRLTFEERERMRQQQRDADGCPGGERLPFGGGSRDAWEHVSGSRDGFGGPPFGGSGSRDGFPAGFGRGGGRGGWGPGGGRGGFDGGREREREREGGRAVGSSTYREPPTGR